MFTGCCIKDGDTYYIFYTGHNPHLRAKGLPEQKVLRATSKDLINWEKDKDFVFEAPEWLEMHDFRDPFVFYDEDKKKYCMLLAGRVKNENPVNSKGVTLIAYSDDLTSWEVAKEPFYEPHAYFTHECPDLFKMGNYWYLVFSEFTDKIVTTYRISESPFGPWRTPLVNNFDAHAFYAAKSTTDGKRRILFGWNCIKFDEKDDNFWQWGGTVIPHEIVQAEDGTLYIKCPEEVRAAYSEDKRNALHSFCHADGGYHLMGCILSAASCNAWWADGILGTDDYAKEQAGLDKQLGDNNVYFLPYLMGERSPHNDVNARGAFIGMRPDTTRGQMTLAVMEGVAFALKDCLEAARANGVEVERTKICGGGAKSPLWRQIIADVFDMPVDIPVTEQGPSYGAAMLAMVGCGEYADVKSAADAIVRVSETVLPDKSAEKYRERYAMFAKLYPALKDVFRDMSGR